jgi:hypothetical protein
LNPQADAFVLRQFGANDFPFADTFNHFEVPISNILLEHYGVLVWHSFNNSENPINEWDLEVLAQWLDHGGKLILSGPYVVTQLDRTDFIHDYLGAEMQADDPLHSLVMGYPGDDNFASTRLFLGGGESVGAPARSPLLRAEERGRAILHYDRSGNDLGVAGVANENETYRTLLLSFPLESIGGAAHYDTIESFLGRTWNWLNSELAAPDGKTPVPYRLSLDPAFPNPFNARTVVLFNLARTGMVHLGVYDLTGRQVAILLEGERPAGRNEFTLDAGALGLASGQYHLRLDSDGQILSRSVLFLR